MLASCAAGATVVESTAAAVLASCAAGWIVDVAELKSTVAAVDVPGTPVATIVVVVVELTETVSDVVVGPGVPAAAVVDVPVSKSFTAVVVTGCPDEEILDVALTDAVAIVVFPDCPDTTVVEVIVTDVVLMGSPDDAVVDVSYVLAVGAVDVPISGSGVSLGVSAGCPVPAATVSASPVFWVPEVVLGGITPSRVLLRLTWKAVLVVAGAEFTTKESVKIEEGTGRVSAEEKVPTEFGRGVFAARPGDATTDSAVPRELSSGNAFEGLRATFRNFRRMCMLMVLIVTFAMRCAFFLDGEAAVDDL